MSRYAAWVACEKDDYENVIDRTESTDGLAGVLTGDEVYEHVAKTEFGLEFVDGSEPVDTDDYNAWLKWDTNSLPVSKTDKGDFVIKFECEAPRVKWFRKLYDFYRIAAQDAVKLTPEEFAQYRLSDDPCYRLRQTYERQFEGVVLVVDSYGIVHESDTPMEFLRAIDAGKEYVISGKVWIYK